MRNIILITSVINTCFNALSYSNTRSFCNMNQRLNDTLKTIESIQKFIPDTDILLVECSELPLDIENILLNKVTFFINLINSTDIKEKVQSSSKSWGEGTMTINAIQYLQNKSLHYDNFFKISGRYWLNDNFDYNKFISNNKIVCRFINSNPNIISTTLYKIPYNLIDSLKVHLENSQIDFENAVGYEMIFASFVNKFKDNMINIKEKIGINGFISVDGLYVDI